MWERRLKLRDVVRLRSGGPMMTVTDVGVNTVGVQWFTDGRLVSSRFHREALRKSFFPAFF